MSRAQSLASIYSAVTIVWTEFYLRPPPRADTQGRLSDPLFSIYPNQNKAPVTLQDVVSQDGRSTEITLGSVQHVIHRRITMDQTETVQSDREKTGATVTIRCP